MSRILIRTDNLTKRFKLYPKPSGRLVEWLSLGRATRHADFWALRDFSLQVNHGECIGIIGPNGAGKSTLLKILSGTLSPTSGSFNVEGKVLSLLELGTGFSQELTGRQNVIETASLLGFPDGYVEERMDDILAFSELGEFFDRPIKIYSSGMSVRLAFSMFVFLKPDVFIVDEALAVGDVGFQRKCYRKIEQMLASGVTCLLVTHDLSAVVQFCHRAVVMMAGQKAFEGDPREAVNLLNNVYFGIAAPSGAEESAGDGSATIEEIWFEDDRGEHISSSPSRMPIAFCNRVRFNADVAAPVFGFHIKTVHGVEVVLASSELLGYEFGPFRAGERAVVRWKLDLNLNPGSYFFGCGCRYRDTEKFLARRVDAIKFPISDLTVVGGIVNPIREMIVEHVPVSPSQPVAVERVETAS
jgi:ABC-type polysaccharide/polyol phosphate transport system ATPase subunit